MLELFEGFDKNFKLFVFFLNFELLDDYLLFCYWFWFVIRIFNKLFVSEI